MKTPYDYKYFVNCETLEDVKHIYKKLLMQYHPDRNPAPNATKMTQAINAEYELAFEAFKNIHRNAEGETYTKATSETPDLFKKILHKLLKLDGLEINLCGCWLWIAGNTKPHKEALKAAGCKWCSNKKMWAWHPPEMGKTSKRKFEFSEICDKFGCERITTKQADLSIA